MADIGNEAREPSVSGLQRCLKRLFPDSEVRREHVGGRRTQRPDLEVEINGTLIAVELLESTSTASLIDAAESLRHRYGNETERIPVLAAPYLGPRKQELLRELGTAFLDLAGNAWIVAPGLHVDRRGFSGGERESRERRDVFSDKATLVLRVLLGRQEPLGVRQIAEIVEESPGGASLSPGYVSKVVSELERQGYASRRDSKVALRHRRELLADWVGAYRSRRKPKSKGYFLPAPDTESLLPSLVSAFAAADLEYVFTGHAGAGYVAPFAFFDVVDINVKIPAEADEVLAQLGAREVERGANVTVGLPYYRTSAFFDFQMPKPDVKVASDIQLYLDLYDYPIRGREQADHLYERRLAPLIGGDVSHE